jgi:hypothetical protein
LRRSFHWGDPTAVRHGRNGQRQQGVDIYGRPAVGGHEGIQCKGKSIWPPAALTTAEITKEVNKAKKFSPRLSRFTIVTTANDDAVLQAHARDITKRHAKRKLFSVHVLGWQELTRRIKTHDTLIEKYYGYTGLQKLKAAVDDVPERTAALVIDTLRTTKVDPPSSSVPSGTERAVDALAPALTDALQRDFSRQYASALQRMFFLEIASVDLFRQLADRAEQSDLARYVPDLCRSIYLRASRSCAVRKDIGTARRFLELAEPLRGTESDRGARARLLAATGDPDAAIRLLRDVAEADARSILLNTLAAAHGDDAALVWLAEQKLGPADLTANGVLTLCQIHLRRQQFDEVLRILAGLPDERLIECPYFYFLRGAVRFASVFAKPDQAFVINGFPLDLLHSQPALSDVERAPVLDMVLTDLDRFLPFAAELQLRDARRIAENTITWAELLHPSRKPAALMKLRQDMQVPAVAVQKLVFALAFDPQYDAAPLRAFLQRRENLGGLDGEELRAILILQIQQNDPRAIAHFVQGHRAQLEAVMGKASTLSIEIQALAMAKDATAARLAYDDNKDVFDPEMQARLAAEVAKAEGADPVTEYLRVYETLKTTDALRELVRALVQAQDHRSIARYAEELHGQTGAPHDIVLAARAAAQAGDQAMFIRLVEHHPVVLERDGGIALHYAWQLLRLGRLAESKCLCEQLKTRSSPVRDLNLEIALAIETGHWDQLPELMSACLAEAEADGPALIRAAHLAQAAGQGPMTDLMEAALAKSSNDPNVLLAAYTLVLEEGLEELRPEAQTWFQRALALSDANGPIQQFELKELLPKHLEWTKHTQHVADLVARGQLPLAFAAPGLRTTVVDVVLRNCVRNSAVADPRQRVALTLFTGTRLPTTIGAPDRVAIDVSALMVLGWLGLLPKVFAAFPEVVLSSTVLTELFEGRRRIRQFQKSRLTRAKQVHDAIARGKLKVFRASAIGRDALTDEIGVELAGLIRASEATGGFVLRPAPAHALGLDNPRDADMSAFAPRLVDMHSLLAVLADHGAVDQSLEKTAGGYFSLQDAGWKTSVRPALDRPLYLDGLALTYLQTVNLFDIVLNTFAEVSVDASTADEAAALIDYDHHVQEVQDTIESIRLAVRNAQAAGKIIFGPQRPSKDSHEGPDASTLDLFSDFKCAEAIVVDDRALNREPYATDQQQHRARCATTLDLIDELAARGALSRGERDVLRHRLRVAGAVLVPVDAQEILQAARRNRQAESPEFRAIRESVALARAAEVPLFPAEMPWLLSVVSATKEAILQSWNEENETPRAAELSNAIFELRPQAEEWLGQWQGQPPPNWLNSVKSVLIATLAMPIEIADPQKRAAYHAWFDNRVLTPLQRIAPLAYDSIIAYLKQFVIGVTTNDKGLEEMARVIQSRRKPRSTAARPTNTRHKKRA